MLNGSFDLEAERVPDDPVTSLTRVLGFRLDTEPVDESTGNWFVIVTSTLSLVGMLGFAAQVKASGLTELRTDSWSHIKSYMLLLLVFVSLNAAVAACLASNTIRTSFAAYDFCTTGPIFTVPESHIGSPDICELGATIADGFGYNTSTCNMGSIPANISVITQASYGACFNTGSQTHKW